MRRMIITAVTVIALVLSGAPSYAADGDPTVSVTDRPGAPREMMQQLEKLTGRSLGTLDKVIAVDSGRAELTVKDVEALAAGAEVDGAKVLGVMPGSKDLLETTMTDLSDGTYDGPRGTESFSSRLIFFSFVPGYEWCLTMCMSSGHTHAECVSMSRQASA